MLGSIAPGRCGRVAGNVLQGLHGVVLQENLLTSLKPGHKMYNMKFLMFYCPSSNFTKEAAPAVVNALEMTIADDTNPCIYGPIGLCMHKILHVCIMLTIALV